MIIDSHCHAWAYWPYKPPVPDPEQRGQVEQLLHEMDTNEVDKALIVCAQIEHNPKNNNYIADQVARFPDKLYQLADLDCVWSPTYHTPGAADRLRRMAGDWHIRGFTHYLDKKDDGSWLTSGDGEALFRTAAELGLLASLSCQPHQLPAIRAAAEKFPSVPVLLHHLGSVKADEPLPQEKLNEVLAASATPNIYIKLSGFAHASNNKWNFPYPDVQPLVRAEYEHFGPQRMCWGSDYPVVRFAMTYRQSIEAFRSHCTFITEADKEWVLGRTLERLLSGVLSS